MTRGSISARSVYGDLRERCFFRNRKDRREASPRYSLVNGCRRFTSVAGILSLANLERSGGKSEGKSPIFGVARLARVDETLLGPIKHGSEEAQRDLLQLKLRDNLVRQRVNIISSVRFSLKSLGVKTRSTKTSYFAAYVRRELMKENGASSGMHDGI